MQFLFHDEAGADRLVMKGEAFNYIIKVRRHQVGERVALRRRDVTEILYGYRLVSTDGRRAELVLESEVPCVVRSDRPLHIGWCAIDPKSVEKVLPQLNEMGVSQITLIRCERSQRQFRHDLKRYRRLLEASMQQCGRSEWMALDTADSLAAFIQVHPATVVLDFCNAKLEADAKIETVLIGCEGGFSAEEKQQLAACRIRRFDSPMVLRSESAAVAISAKLLV